MKRREFILKRIVDVVEQAAPNSEIYLYVFSPMIYTKADWNTNHVLTPLFANIKVGKSKRKAQKS